MGKVSVNLSVSEAAFFLGAIASRVMRMEDILYKGATRDRGDTRTRQEIEDELVSARAVMYKLQDGITTLAQ